MKVSLKHRIIDRKSKIVTMIDDFGGNPMVFDCQKTLLKLLIVLLCATLVVIRGSTAPLIANSAALHFFFYTDPNGDKTLYNIGISVIAAFIFYVFQVYIPEYKKCKRDCLVFSTAHRHEIYLLNQYTLAWKEFLGKKAGECHFFEFSYKLSPHDGGAVTKLTYEETIEGLPQTLLKIMNNPLFMNCDIAYQAFINYSYSVISGHLIFMDDQFPHWSDSALEAKDCLQIQSMVMDDMKRIQRRFSSIEKYKLNVISTSPYTGRSLLERLE